MIERHFDIAFIADLALREKQIQQNYRPVIAVHKWFARRPGTLFRGLLLAEFSSKPLSEAFYQPHNFSGRLIADPFMGGGTPLLEANRVGCDVIGFDINPMSFWIVKQEIEHLDLKAYGEAAQTLRIVLEKEIGYMYRTRCLVCGSTEARVKYFLWVKTQVCQGCHREIDLFPGYLLATDARHPKNVLVCAKCGQLTETDDRKNPGRCRFCGVQLSPDGPARRSRVECPDCGTKNIYPNPKSGAPRHRLFAIEYHCFHCRKTHKGRFFKKPDDLDFALLEQAEKKWLGMSPRFVPGDEIPRGDETDRLHRWGYRQYREMFNHRQLLGLERSAQLIAENKNDRVRNALATNLSDLLRYQNLLCRYDTMALKSLDIFSVHGFPVGLIPCESNILGLVNPERKTCIGSGGWANIIDKFIKAKAYCDQPFEVRHRGRTKEVVSIKGEWIGDRLNNSSGNEQRKVELYCLDAAKADLPPGTLDAVFTDPPYFGNVQYAELMDFCYVWLRRLVGRSFAEFNTLSTRNADELTGNENMGRDLNHFTEGLSRIYQETAKALKPGSPLVFTYHHNDIKAYYPVAVAILDSGLACSASLPCPGEMGASIHINKTGSSIIDTIFVCRSKGTVPRRWLPGTPSGVAELVKEDLEELYKGKIKPTPGDIRCIAYGHLIRLAIWFLRPGWDKTDKTETRLNRVAGWLAEFGGWPEVEKYLKNDFSSGQFQKAYMVRDTVASYGDENDQVSF